MRFLQRRHGRVADFHGEVAARDHDAVGGIQDLVELRDRLGALDLRDQHGDLPPAARMSWRAMYMSAELFGKRHREEVRLRSSRPS
jgi:hypothetical protein